jgi:hypothetical protein
MKAEIAMTNPIRQTPLEAATTDVLAGVSFYIEEKEEQSAHELSRPPIVTAAGAPLQPSVEELVGIYIEVEEEEWSDSSLRQPIAIEHDGAANSYQATSNDLAGAYVEVEEEERSPS